jgi:putative GTP pyrophosphokinase
MNQIEVKEIVEKWTNEKPRYEQLGKIIETYIKQEIVQYEVLPQVTSRPKELSSIIKKIIKKRIKEPTYSYNSLTDKLGIRIITYFKSDLNRVHRFINGSRALIVNKFEAKGDDIKFNTLDYVSDHYDLKINIEEDIFKGYEDFKDVVFELQARTLNQHVWADIEHDLTYKQEEELDEKLKRRIFRLISLYELADDEFDTINSMIQSLPNNDVYNILKSMEGKFYRYAQSHFDKEFSIQNIKILLSGLSKENIIKIKTSIGNYINTNADKVEAAFKDHNFLKSYNIFMGQPEVFLVWYMLENHEYVLRENWEKQYNMETLKELGIYWSVPIN